MLNILTNPYKNIEIEDKNGDVLVIGEGDMVEFALESTGEVIKGAITKFALKNEKLKIQIFNPKKNCEEIWSIVLIKEGSLKLVEEIEKDDNDDDLD